MQLLMVKKKKRNPRVKKSNTDNWGTRGVSVQVAATIIVPSGQCPYEMEEFSRESVVEWVKSVTKAKASAHTYKREVYTYWLRHSFELWTEEYKKSKVIVEEVVPDYVKTIQDLNI